MTIFTIQLLRCINGRWFYFISYNTFPSFTSQQESENRGRRLGCQLATAQATAVPSQRLLYRLGYESLYTMDYTTFEIAGDRVFDMDRMLGTPSAKVMAKQIDEDLKEH